MTKSKAEGKHDRLCSIIKEEFERRGYDAYQNVNYNDKFTDGEIDVIAYSKDKKYAIDVEVKCNKREKNTIKAHNQLNRAREHYHGFKNKRLFTFLAYYVNGGYTMEWYKNDK